MLKMQTGWRGGCSRGVRRIQHGQRVGDILLLRISCRVCGAIRFAIAAPIEGHDAVVARQIGDLHLPKT
jgi:hypothetical protein